MRLSYTDMIQPPTKSHIIDKESEITVMEAVFAKKKILETIGDGSSDHDTNSISMDLIPLSPLRLPGTDPEEVTEINFTLVSDELTHTAVETYTPSSEERNALLLLSNPNIVNRDPYLLNVINSPAKVLPPRDEAYQDIADRNEKQLQNFRAEAVPVVSSGGFQAPHSSTFPSSVIELDDSDDDDDESAQLSSINGPVLNDIEGKEEGSDSTEEMESESEPDTGPAPRTISPKDAELTVHRAHRIQSQRFEPLEVEESWTSSEKGKKCENVTIDAIITAIDKYFSTRGRKSKWLATSHTASTSRKTRVGLYGQRLKFSGTNQYRYFKIHRTQKNRSHVGFTMVLEKNTNENRKRLLAITCYGGFQFSDEMVKALGLTALPIADNEAEYESESASKDEEDEDEDDESKSLLSWYRNVGFQNGVLNMSAISASPSTPDSRKENAINNRSVRNRSALNYLDILNATDNLDKQLEVWQEEWEQNKAKTVFQAKAVQSQKKASSPSKKLKRKNPASTHLDLRRMKRLAEREKVNKIKTNKISNFKSLEENEMDKDNEAEAVYSDNTDTDEKGKHYQDQHHVDPSRSIVPCNSNDVKESIGQSAVKKLYSGFTMPQLKSLCSQLQEKVLLLQQNAAITKNASALATSKVERQIQGNNERFRVMHQREVDALNARMHSQKAYIKQLRGMICFTGWSSLPKAALFWVLQYMTIHEVVALDSASSGVARLLLHEVLVGMASSAFYMHTYTTEASLEWIRERGIFNPITMTGPEQEQEQENIELNVQLDNLPQGMNSFTYLVMLGKFKLAKWLLSVGVFKINAPSAEFQNSEGNFTKMVQPIHLAAIRNNADAIHFLVKECSADVNSDDARTWTALHWACLNSNIEATRALLDCGADLEAYTDSPKRTPLLISCQKTVRLEILVMLINAGARVDVVDEENNSALIIACDNHYHACAQILLDNNAPANIVNTAGYTPLKIAMLEPEDLEMQRLLWKSGATVFPENVPSSERE